MRASSSYSHSAGSTSKNPHDTGYLPNPASISAPAADSSIVDLNTQYIVQHQQILQLQGQNRELRRTLLELQRRAGLEEGADGTSSRPTMNRESELEEVASSGALFQDDTGEEIEVIGGADQGGQATTLFAPGTATASREEILNAWLPDHWREQVAFLTMRKQAAKAFRARMDGHSPHDMPIKIPQVYKSRQDIDLQMFALVNAEEAIRVIRRCWNDFLVLRITGRGDVTNLQQSLQGVQAIIQHWKLHLAQFFGSHEPRRGHFTHWVELAIGFLWHVARWKADPSYIDRLPPTLRPSPLQLSVPHPDVIDFFPWPEARDALIVTGGDTARFIAKCIENIVPGREPTPASMQPPPRAAPDLSDEFDRLCGMVYDRTEDQVSSWGLHPNARIEWGWCLDSTVFVPDDGKGWP